MLFFGDDILKNPSASGGIAPRPLPRALPPDPHVIFLLFHFSPVPCLIRIVMGFWMKCSVKLYYIAEMKPQKTVILTDSKAALQSLTSNTPDQPIHQLLKDLQFLPHKCNMVLQWIPAHCGIPGSEKADHLAKSGSKQLQPMSTSTYQEDKTLLRNRQKMSMEKSRWRLQPLHWPYQPSGKTWADHYIQVANRTLWPVSALEANWHYGLCTLRLQRSRTDGPQHPPGLSHLAETETPVMATGWVNHQQAVGNGRRPAQLHPIPGNMWTDGLSMADWPQKKTKKKKKTLLL